MQQTQIQVKVTLVDSYSTYTFWYILLDYFLVIMYLFPVIQCPFYIKYTNLAWLHFYKNVLIYTALCLK